MEDIKVSFGCRVQAVKENHPKILVPLFAVLGLSCSIAAAVSMAFLSLWLATAFEPVASVSSACPMPWPAAIALAVTSSCGTALSSRALFCDESCSNRSLSKVLADKLAEADKAVARRRMDEALSWMDSALTPVAAGFPAFHGWKKKDKPTRSDIWFMAKSLSCGHEKLLPEHPAYCVSVNSIAGSEERLAEWRAESERDRIAVSALVTIWEECLHGVRIDLRHSESDQLLMLAEACGALPLIECYATGVAIEDVLGHPLQR